MAVRIGKQVQTLRARAGMSRTELAQSADVSLTQLLALEAGRVDVRVSTLDCLSRALDVALSDLVPEDVPDSTVTEHSKPYFRLMARLRAQSPDYCRVALRLLDALDDGVATLSP